MSGLNSNVVNAYEINAGSAPSTVTADSWSSSSAVAITVLAGASVDVTPWVSSSVLNASVDTPDGNSVTSVPWISSEVPPVQREGMKTITPWKSSSFNLVNVNDYIPVEKEDVGLNTYAINAEPVNGVSVGPVFSPTILIPSWRSSSVSGSINVYERDLSTEIFAIDYVPPYDDTSFVPTEDGL